jgi:hypothetical protein
MENKETSKEISGLPLASIDLLDALLKPCPFCGGENPSRYLKDSYYTIQCTKCGVMMCDYYYLPLDRWNVRK